MTIGLFDPAALPLGWFAEETQPAGWFDAILLNQASGPATITGTLAATDGADTAAASGLIAHVGTLAATDSADAALFSGNIAHTGNLVATDGIDTATFSGLIAHVGAMDATDGADSAEFVGNTSGVIITPIVVGGGIGHGGNKKRVYVKRGDQILIFKDGDAAKSWIEQEREAEKERQRAEKKPYRPRKVIKLTVKTEPESIIKLPVLERLSDFYGMAENYASMLRQADYEAIARIYDKLRQREEEEVLAVLLVA